MAMPFNTANRKLRINAATSKSLRKSLINTGAGRMAQAMLSVTAVSSQLSWPRIERRSAAWPSCIVIKRKRIHTAYEGYGGKGGKA